MLAVLMVPEIIIGALGKKVIEEDWDRGRKWLAAYFAEQQPETLAIAKERASDFLNRLAEKVERIHEQQAVDREVIERAMIDPSFGATLHRALIHSAETANETAHAMLAILVAEKMVTPPDQRRPRRS